MATLFKPLVDLFLICYFITLLCVALMYWTIEALYLYFYDWGQAVWGLKRLKRFMGRK